MPDNDTLNGDNQNDILYANDGEVDTSIDCGNQSPDTAYYDKVPPGAVNDPTPVSCDVLFPS